MTIDHLKNTMKTLLKNLTNDINNIKKRFKNDNNINTFVKDFTKTQTLLYRLEHYLKKLENGKIIFKDSL